MAAMGWLMWAIKDGRMHSDLVVEWGDGGLGLLAICGAGAVRMNRRTVPPEIVPAILRWARLALHREPGGVFLLRVRRGS